MSFNRKSNAAREGLAQQMGLRREQRPDGMNLNLQPMSDLDLMIANGWGSTPQTQIPADWRTRKKPADRRTFPKSVKGPGVRRHIYG